MIPKKLISYCMFAIFVFSYSDAFGMAAGIKKPTSKNNSKYMLLQQVLLAVMQMNISMELNGVDEQKTVEDQWKRFIESKLEENTVTHNVSGLLPEWYNLFIERINIADNRTSYLDLIQQILNQSDYLGFYEFFSNSAIKKIFIDLGTTFVNSLPNSPVKQAERRLLDANVNPASAKTVEAANEFLKIDSDGITSRQEIEKAYNQKMIEIKNLELAEKEQLQFQQAAKIAKQVLETQLVVSAPSPVPVPTSSPKHHRRIKTPAGDDQPQNTSDEFREKVQEVGMGIALNIYRSGRLVVTGNDINDFFMNPEISFSNKITNEDTAYFMGYVQNCIYQLQKSSGNSAPKSSGNSALMIAKLAEVLKALNQQAARA